MLPLTTGPICFSVLVQVMKVIIRNPVRREIEVSGSRRVGQLLQELDLNAEAHIVIRKQELLTTDDLLSSEDEIEVLSAISGG